MQGQALHLWMVVAAVAIAGLALAQWREGDWILYNHSPSIPRGFYVRVADAPANGALVTVRAVTVAPAEAAQRAFDGPHDRFIKTIAAAEGDRVCAHGDIVSINDRPVARRLHRDRASRPLPAWSGCRRLGRGDLLLLGDAADSFDGRYWGVVRSEVVEGVWRRLPF